MPSIPVSQASPIYTSAVVARFDELREIKVNNFFGSFFPDLPCPDRYPVIDIRRGSEKVAADVVRGSQGTRVQISKSSQKAFDPFYYKLYFDATELTQYFRVFGSKSFNENDMAELANSVAVEMKTLQDMIDRGKELHAANVLLTGTCTSIRDSSVVDFKRLAASMVATTGLTAGTWDNPGSNPFADLKAGGDFLRQKGKYSGYVINAVFGTAAWAAYRNTAIVNDRLKQFNNLRDTLDKAQLESTGALYQGTIDADSYLIHCWTYNEVYDDPSTGVSTPYMDPKKVVMLPPNPGFNMLYGAIPQINPTGVQTSSLEVAPYVLKRFINAEEGYDRHYIESSPLPVPKAVDRIYTVTVLS